MRRRLLLLYKDPEFDERGEVILGQCEPFTSGWKLVLLSPDDSREVLLTGTYTDLRKVQEACSSVDDPAAVRQRAQQMSALLSSAVTETVAVEFRASSANEPTRITSPVEAGEPVPEPVPAQLGDGLLTLKQEQGAIVALVADPQRASDPALLSPQLGRLLELKPRGIVLDLSRVSHLASRIANELVLFRDRCQEQKVSFGLCRVRRNVQRLFESLEHPDPPAVYATCEAALAEMGPPK